MTIRQLESLLRRVLRGADPGIDTEALRRGVEGEAAARRVRREWVFFLGMALLAAGALLAWALGRGL